MSGNDGRPDGVGIAREAGLREISDARTMRALAHPVRIAIIEVLFLGGAMTATEVGEQIGESPTTCSFHLRQLAKYGFVEEAGGGKGRARPWRMTSIGLSFSGNPEDHEFDLATNAVLRLVRQRILDRYQTWVQTRNSYPKEWRHAANESEFVFYLTAAELDELNKELTRMLVPLMDRLRDPALRPPGSAPVEMLLLTFPLGMPHPDAANTDEAGADGGIADESGAGQDGSGR
jgi:DNA-binding transcriptional ArsR family regulator